MNCCGKGAPGRSLTHGGTNHAQNNAWAVKQIHSDELRKAFKLFFSYYYSFSGITVKLNCIKHSSNAVRVSCNVMTPSAAGSGWQFGSGVTSRQAFTWTERCPHIRSVASASYCSSEASVRTLTFQKSFFPPLPYSMNAEFCVNNKRYRWEWFYASSV